MWFKSVVFSILFAFASVAYSQLDVIPSSVIPSDRDSIELSIWKVVTKEMTSPGQSEEEYENELQRLRLPGRMGDVLIRYLQDSSSYKNNRAQLYHYNLVFDFYDHGKVCTQVRISTFTGNLDVEDKVNDRIFRNSCGPNLGQELLGILEKLELSKLFDEIDLQGIGGSIEE